MEIPPNDGKVFSTGVKYLETLPPKDQLTGSVTLWSLGNSAFLLFNCLGTINIFIFSIAKHEFMSQMLSGSLKIGNDKSWGENIQNAAINSEEEWWEIFFHCSRLCFDPYIFRCNITYTCQSVGWSIQFSLEKYFNIFDWIGMVVGSSAQELNALHGGAFLPCTTILHRPSNKNLHSAQQDPDRWGSIFYKESRDPAAQLRASWLFSSCLQHSGRVTHAPIHPISKRVKKMNEHLLNGF